MFITFEGIEGMGKTTQLKWMAKQFTDNQIPVFLTREPGGTPMGEEIRDILLAHRNEQVAPLTELLLMFAARAQHVETVIKPALKEERYVLCDRFVDATYAYQGGGRGVSFDLIEKVEQLVLGDFRPNYTLLFDAPVEVGQKRVRDRGNTKDRFEKEKIDFFERIRKVYLARAKADPNRFIVVDASLSVEAVGAVLLEITKKLIVQYKNSLQLEKQ